MAKKCKRCNKDIIGKIKIITKRIKSGKKFINEVEYYDEQCFYKSALEKATKNEDQNKVYKRKN